MESLSVGLSTSQILLNRPKFQKFVFDLLNPLPNTYSPSIYSKETSHLCLIESSTPAYHENNSTLRRNSNFHGLFLKSHLSIVSTGILSPLPSFASEAAAVSDDASSKINLEAIVVSIDEFFSRNPLFVAGIAFIWLVVIPLTQQYLSKAKFISAFDAFKKLRDDPNCQLLDIREKRSLDSLKSPNLKILNKVVVQVEFREGNEDALLKQVLENVSEPGNTVVCILDNFDGNSMTVAELLVANGFKEAYAIKGGIRGKKGWQEIQETLLPPSVHIKSKKKVKTSDQSNGGGVDSGIQDDVSHPALATGGYIAGGTKEITNGSLNRTTDLPSEAKSGPKFLSPYPNYPDLKPPASPTPSKPKG